MQAEQDEQELSRRDEDNIVGIRTSTRKGPKAGGN